MNLEIEEVLEKSDELNRAIRYGVAKSQQDPTAALNECTDDFVLDAPSLGSTSRGKEHVHRELLSFFNMFPDYCFTCFKTAIGTDNIVLTGQADMTWGGKLPHSIPFWAEPFRSLKMPKRKIRLPAIAVFETDGGLLSREFFLIDALQLARQMRVPASIFRILTQSSSRQRGGSVSPVGKAQVPE